MTIGCARKEGPMRLIITLEQPPESHIVTSGALLEWLKKRGDACFQYRNSEGNLEDGAIVAMDGQLFVGTRPSLRCIEDFEDWRDLLELTKEGDAWIFHLSNGRYTERRQMIQLNVLSQLPSDDHRRL
ncbi:MAG: hypothetical protein ABIO72_00325 [Patescibacteria group bacterium]